MQLCYVVPSQPQTDDMVDVAAVLSRWHLIVLHEDGSGELWRARVSDLVLRSGGKNETNLAAGDCKAQHTTSASLLLSVSR